MTKHMPGYRTTDSEGNTYFVPGYNEVKCTCGTTFTASTHHACECGQEYDSTGRPLMARLTARNA